MKFFLLFFLAINILGCKNTETKNEVASETQSKITTKKEICANLKGTIKKETRGNGQEYKVCEWKQNKICELESLKKELCTPETINLSQKEKPEQRYCIIRGGKYSETKTGKGKCTLPNEKMCAAQDFFNGNCDYLIEEI